MRKGDRRPHTLNNRTKHATIYQLYQEFLVPKYKTHQEEPANYGIRLFMLDIVKEIRIIASGTMPSLPFVHHLILAFCKYLVAGGIGFILDFGTLYILYDICGVNYLVAAAVAFMVGLIFVYLTCNRWVFFNRQMENRRALEFTIFTIIGLIGLALTVFFMWFLVDYIGLHPLASKLVTTALVLCWNFGTRKLILY